jgi:hypothetical protein
MGSLFIWQPEHRSSLVFVLLCGLSLGLVSVVTGVLQGLSGSQLPERLSLSPNKGIWLSSGNGLFFVLVGWLLFIVLVGLFVGLSGWLFSMVFTTSLGRLHGLVVVLFLGLLVGLAIGLLYGLGAFVKHFVLRFLLWLRGDDLPWNLVPFLDEAAERLLLRKVGGSYIFVHRLLMDYFAELEENVSD